MTWSARKCVQIQAYGNPETTTGGKSLAFYSSMRMKLSRVKNGPSVDENGEERGIRVKAQVRSSAPCSPGIDRECCRVAATAAAAGPA